MEGDRPPWGGQGSDGGGGPPPSPPMSGNPAKIIVRQIILQSRVFGVQFFFTNCLFAPALFHLLVLGLMFFVQHFFYVNNNGKLLFFTTHPFFLHFIFPSNTVVIFLQCIHKDQCKTDVYINKIQCESRKKYSFLFRNEIIYHDIICRGTICHDVICHISVCQDIICHDVI